jgi:hypothetical protein
MYTIIIIFTIVFFIMFFYSGVDKIINFNDKVDTLYKKLDSKIGLSLLKLAMICVILLEIVGPIIILLRIILAKKSPAIVNLLSNITFALLILFILIVTLLYHPFSFSKPIPFLSNCTTLAGIVFLLIISNSNLIEN